MSICLLYAVQFRTCRWSLFIFLAQCFVVHTHIGFHNGRSDGGAHNQDAEMCAHRLLRCVHAGY